MYGPNVASVTGVRLQDAVAFVVQRKLGMGGKKRKKKKNAPSKTIHCHI